MLAASHSPKNTRGDNPDAFRKRGDSAQKRVIQNSFKSFAVKTKNRTTVAGMGRGRFCLVALGICHSDITW